MGHEFTFEVIPLDQVEDRTPDAMPEADERIVVMVVDDEPLIVDSLAAILAREGLAVMKAYNAASALALAEAQPPSLLLTDVAMPGMNGIELAMTVATTMPQCRVLLFSGHASLLDLGPAREAGFDFPLLSKPIHPREMVGRIFASLQSHPVHRRPRRHDNECGFLWQAPQVSL